MLVLLVTASPRCSDIAVVEISVENGELAPADTSRLVGEKGYAHQHRRK